MYTVKLYKEVLFCTDNKKLAEKVAAQLKQDFDEKIVIERH